MSKCLTSKSVLRRMSVQLELPYPSTSQDLQNMSTKILEQELQRQRALEVPVSSEHCSAHPLGDAFWALPGPHARNEKEPTRQMDWSAEYERQWELNNYYNTLYPMEDTCDKQRV